MKVIIGIFVIILLGLTCALKGCFDKGCIFAGKKYEEGKTLNFSCFILVCQRGVWNFTGIDVKNCDKCHLQDDPHIYSFDSHDLVWLQAYHWYGVCNYSLSQPAICKEQSSYNPPFAVYGDFVFCNDGASCVDYTTYKIDSNTVVTIQHKTLIPNSLDINGNTFSPLPAIPSAVFECSSVNFYPAIVWRDGNCAYVVGEPFSIKACRADLYIYTNKKNSGKLVGLCGYYSGNKDDDFVPRESCFSPIPFADFAISWLTHVHKDDCDIKKEYDIYKKSVDIEEACDKKKFYDICKRQVYAGYRGSENVQERINETEVGGSIENCVLDCCFNPDTCNEWAEIARQMANVAYETKLQENGIIPSKKFQ